MTDKNASLVAKPRKGTLAPKYKFLSTNDLRNLPDPQWLIGSNETGKGILPKNGLSVLFGPPGTGKSFLALDWAASIASGDNWSDYDVSQGYVLYICAEGVTGFKSRVAAWELNRGFDLAKSNQIAFCPTPVIFDSNQTGTEFARDALRHCKQKPSLIVVDTLARCFGGSEENSATEMGRFIDCLGEVRNNFDDCAVLVVHHTSKGEPTKPRGSTSLPGAADTMFSLSSNKNILSLKCVKQKDAEPIIPLSLKLHVLPCGNGRSSCVLELIGFKDASNDNSKASKESEAERKDDTALLELASANNLSLTHSEWMQACEAQGIKSGTFKHVRGRLQDRGLVTKDVTGTVWTLTTSGREWTGVDK